MQASRNAAAQYQINLQRMAAQVEQKALLLSIGHEIPAALLSLASAGYPKLVDLELPRRKTLFDRSSTEVLAGWKIGEFRYKDRLSRTAYFDRYTGSLFVVSNGRLAKTFGVGGGPANYIEPSEHPDLMTTIRDGLVALRARPGG